MPPIYGQSNQVDDRALELYLTARRIQAQMRRAQVGEQIRVRVDQQNFLDGLYIQPIPVDQVIGTDAYFRRIDAQRAQRRQQQYPELLPPPTTQSYQSTSTSGVGSHPPELESLIFGVRNYYSAIYREGIADPARPNTPSRAGIPSGFPLLSNSGTTYVSQYPSYVFINRLDPSGNGRRAVYYRHRDSSNSYWRCMTSGYDDAIFELRGGNGVSGDRSYMVQVNGNGSSSNTTPPPGAFGSGTTTRVPSTTTTSTAGTTGSTTAIPPRAGDPVGFSPASGQQPLRVEEFNTDLSGLTFTVRINAREQFARVAFKPQYATSRDMFENRTNAHLDLSRAGIRVVPRFVTRTHQGSRGPWQSQELVGFNIEFYNPGDYIATTRDNFYNWYLSDSHVRAAMNSRERSTILRVGN